MQQPMQPFGVGVGAAVTLVGGCISPASCASVTKVTKFPRVTNSHVPVDSDILYLLREFLKFTP